jgi:hypothetical protein
METVQVSTAAVLATDMVVVTVTALTITGVDQAAGRGWGMAEASAAEWTTRQVQVTVEVGDETSTLGQLRQRRRMGRR